MAGPYGKLKADKLEWWDTSLNGGAGGDREHTLEDIADKATVANPEFTGNVKLTAQGELRLADTDSSNYVGFKSPGTVASDVVWTLPAADGSSGNSLQTNGSGTLSWSTTDLSALAPLADPDFTGVVDTAGQLNINSNDGLFINDDINIRRDSAANKNYIECTHADEHDLVIEVQDGKSITLQTDDGSFGYETLAKFQGDGAAELYYNGGTAKLETTTGGVKVNGDLETTNTIQGTYASSSVGEKFKIARVTASGNPDTVDGRQYTTYYTTMQVSSAEDLHMELHADTIFEIKWDNPNGYANDSLSTTDYGRLASFKPQEGVKLFYNDVKKFETTTDGVTVTALTVDDKNIELATVANVTSQAATADLVTTDGVVTVASTAGYLENATVTKVAGTGAFAAGVTIASIDSATQFTVSAPHATAGTITDFTVENQTDLTANGGGITLKGSTDKTILWSDTTDSWDFNQSIRDPKGDVRQIPQEDTRANLAADHVLVSDNAGEHLLFQPAADYVAGSAGTKVTVNQNVFSAGDAITIVNHSPYTLFIEKGTASIYNTADGTDASRTLAARGMATILFVTASTCYISGAGLS